MHLTSQSEYALHINVVIVYWGNLMSLYSENVWKHCYEKKLCVYEYITWLILSMDPSFMYWYGQDHFLL